MINELKTMQLSTLNIIGERKKEKKRRHDGAGVSAGVQQNARAAG